MNWETSLLILSLAVAVGVAFTIPVLLQLLRTIRNLDRTVTTLNQDLPRILKNVDFITDHVRMSVEEIRATVEQAVNRTLPSLLANLDLLTIRLGKTVESVRGRMEALSSGIEKVRGGIHQVDERLTDRTRVQVSHALKGFAGLIRRVRSALESGNP